MTRLSSRQWGQGNRARWCGDGRRAHADRTPTASPVGASASAAEKSNAALLRRVVDEIWNGSNVELADELFAPCYANHGGIITDVVSGPEAIKLGVALCRSAFPDLQVSVDELVSDGNLVELAWTARATGPGSLSGTTLIRLADGHILESWTSWNPVGLVRRLGLLPPAEPTDPEH